MLSKKSISLFCLAISLFTTTHSMELGETTLQNKMIAPVIELGIGMASGAAQAIIFNKLNEYYGIDNHYSISRNAIRGAVFMIPVIAASRIGSWPKSESNVGAATMIELVKTSLLSLSHLFMITLDRHYQHIASNAAGPNNNQRTLNDKNTRTGVQNSNKEYSTIGLLYMNAAWSTTEIGFILATRYYIRDKGH